MKRFLLTTALAATAIAGAKAGGYLTNTNQSVNFLRNPARDAVIAIDGAYANPAGIGFMGTGWHLGFDLQSAYQTRTDKVTFAPFALGTVNGVKNDATGYKEFEGKAKAPVIPSFDLARVGERWFASFHFGMTGGGGKCNFNNGLPSFESQVAMLPLIADVLQPGAVEGYSIDTKMRGRQYYFGGQFGVGYKVLPNLNVSVGGRVVYAQCNYYGYVRNIGVTVGGQQMPATAFLESAGMGEFSSRVADRELNCDQSGWGFTPIVSVDYRIGKVNLAARYEFKTRLRLKNQAGVKTSGLSEYDDGSKVKADIPAILTAGVMYEPLEGLRLNGGFHYYFDRQATQHENKHNYLEHGGWEVLAGAEYDVAKRWTISAGWQTTNYGLGKNSKFISDMSFVTNSNSVGVGARFQLRKKVAINIAYFKTFYKEYKRTQNDFYGLNEKYSEVLTPVLAPVAQQLKAGQTQLEAAINTPGLPEEQKAQMQQKLNGINSQLSAVGRIMNPISGTETFHRTNDVFGLGLEIDF